ncbi:MAG: hypothetical protein, partial [Olavius algarvensis Gamma 3 endosymbiont]
CSFAKRCRIARRSFPRKREFCKIVALNGERRLQKIRFLRD